jgi:two-component system sensor histidine kinase KdpD
MGPKDHLYDLFVHDLTGPLSVVSATADSLLKKTDRGGLAEREKSSLERIARNAKKAQRLLKEILDVARSEEHLFQPDRFYPEKVAKEALVNVMDVLITDAGERLERLENREEVKSFLGEKGISIEVSGRYAASPFHHDRRKVQLILQNLMSNAMKYRRKKMDVAISGESDLVILVSDDGCGIPEGDQEVVYKRFMQLKHDDWQSQGVGLGLFCVKALLETMQGEIAVRSGAGCGTTFTVKIPPLAS